MIKFHIIESGYFHGDGGVMFGTVPKKYWSAKYKVDEKNMCVMALRCLFIETDTRRILVDAGIGDKHNSRLKFFQPFDQKDIAGEIRKIGYTPEEVTDVIITHLHFDHCGGCTVFNSDKKAVPTYPNATYHLSLAQWKNYRTPSLFEKGSFFADNIEPVYDAGQLQFVLEDRQLDEQVRLELYDGHTPGLGIVGTQRQRIHEHRLDIAPHGGRAQPLGGLDQPRAILRCAIHPVQGISIASFHRSSAVALN